MVVTTELTPAQRKARENKVLENRLRRWARAQQLRLRKSRRRTSDAPDFGKWWIVGADNQVVAGGARGLTLDELKKELGVAS